MADINGLVNDQDFQKLDAASQRQALAGVTGDQSFANLSDADTAHFITKLAPQNVAAQAAGVSNPGVSTPPLKPQMEAAGLQHIQNEMKLGALQNRAMQSPMPLTDASMVMFPAAELPGAIASGGARAVLGSIGRGMAKSVAGTVAGGAAGAGIGTIFGAPRQGAEIGGTIGGLVSPFAPDTLFARAPYGLNQAILGEEGLADARSASKMAQRAADLRSGYRPPPEPEPYEPFRAKPGVLQGDVSRSTSDMGPASGGRPLGKIPGTGAFIGDVEPSTPTPEPEKVPFRANMKAQLNRGTGKAYDPLAESRGSGPSSRIGSRGGTLGRVSSTASEPELSGDSQDILTRTKKLVIPGQAPNAGDIKRAGDLTQVPLETLQRLAKFDDKLAQNEIIRRLQQ